MSTNCYQIAYEHATNEVAEINAQIESLIRRKELLEKLLEPLELLVPEFGSIAIPVEAGDSANGELADEEPAAQGSPVMVLVEIAQPESEPLEATAPMMQPEVDATNLRARRNGSSAPHEEVALRAYHFWNERGQTHGYHEEDWLRATHELQNSAY